MDASKLETRQQICFEYAQMHGHRLNKLENKKLCSRTL